MSVLLVLSIMSSLLSPFNIMASVAGDGQSAAQGDEEAATGSEIYAFLNYIDGSKTSNKEKYNLELVFKNENVKDSNYYRGPYTNFADIEYVTTTYTFDNTGRTTKKWNYEQWSPANTAAAYRLPWRNDDTLNGDYIRKVTFKNKIAPKSIAGWFANLRYLVKFENFDNLDVSQCENMAFAFSGMNVGTRDESIKDGSENYSKKYMNTLDLSKWDISCFWQKPFKCTNPVQQSKSAEPDF